MPAARICLACDRLFPADAEGRSFGRCAACRPAYVARSKVRMTPRAPNRASVRRADAQRFYDHPAWRRMREIVRRRDGACQACGSTDSLTVHHVRSLHDAPDLALHLDNLVTLCRSCHGREESLAKVRAKKKLEKN